MTWFVCWFLLMLLQSAFSIADDGDVKAVKKLYYGDKVLRLVPSTLDKLQWLYELYLKGDGNVYDFWTAPTGINEPVDLHVRKDALEKFRLQLEKSKFNYTVTINDLQKLIDGVDKAAARKRRHRRDVSAAAAIRLNQPNVVGTFANYEEIVWYLNTICASHPAVTFCGSLGKSFEERDLPYIKLGTTNTNSTTTLIKEEIVIEAGSHAREWLSPATTIYIIDMLVKSYNSGDVKTKKMLEKYDFIFVPLINPDGYEYSRLLERMWRKTRSKSNSSICYGVDANRNFDFNWGLVGSSDEPCSFIYRGTTAFSEPETKAISNFMSARKNTTLAFFSIHAYAQKWLLPYGNGNYPSDYGEMFRVAEIGANALMAVNGEGISWEVGNMADVLWPRTGGIEDWAKSIGIKYSYLLELRPVHHQNTNGFVVDEEEIEPSGREIWAGLSSAVDAMEPLLTAVSQAVVVVADDKAKDDVESSSKTWSILTIISLIAAFLLFIVMVIVIIARCFVCRRGGGGSNDAEKNSRRNRNDKTTTENNPPLMEGDETVP